MNINFDHVMTRIRNANVETYPYQHIHIQNLFTEEDFKKIVQTPEINLKPVQSDDELFEQLFENGYKIIKFPGCIADKDYYSAWHREKGKGSKKVINNDACEGFGMTLRLVSPRSQLLSELKSFIESTEFLSVLAEKFNVDLDNCEADNGIQKYLDGYEISPHPDIRRKALTYMVNINSAPNSEELDHHTRYLVLKDKYKYISTYWEHNTDVERAWIPWEWCDVVFEQTVNNSIVVFSPSYDTLHAVRANYNHLLGQRTQLYGNLWYKNSNVCSPSEWVQLDLVNGVGDIASVLSKRDEEYRKLQRGDGNSSTTHEVKHRV